MDRISNLPEPIIHYVMSFLTTQDVMRTSILSRSFRSVCASFPNIDFDQTLFETQYKLFRGKGTENFLNYVNDWIERRQQYCLFMDKFRLQVTTDCGEQEYRIDKAICFAVEKGVKNLDLEIQSQKYDNLSMKKVCYNLPKSVYSAKSISSLKLTSFKFNLDDLILGCPLIENLSLRRCKWLQEFKVSSSKLKTVELKRCDKLKSVDIKGSSLQSFSYSGNLKHCNINVTACISLKILSLKGALVSDQWVCHHVSNLPLLEVLKLTECQGLKIFKFLKVNLKKIKLGGCHGFMNIDIEGPSLESFEYYGNFMPSEINVYNCGFLKKLSVYGNDITDNWVQDHVSKLLLLESLNLKECKNLRNIKVSNTNMKKIEFDCCNKLQSIEIYAPNLRSFLYIATNGDQSKSCKINIAACKLIKDLTLMGVGITDGWLKEQLSKFLELEKLRLETNHMLERIEIVHERLRSFQLQCCNSLVEIKIDAPQLLSFVYSGNVVSFGCMNSPNLLDPTLCLETPKVKTVKWFSMLRELLVVFDHCYALTLHCSSDEDLIFPEEARASLLSPLYDIRQLRIKISSLSRSYTELVGGLLWLSPHPETLYIVLENKVKSIEFHYDSTETKEDPFCCRAQPIKCWRHYLKTVQMHNFVDGDDTDGLLTYFIWNAKNLDTISTNRKCFKTVGGKYLEQSQMIN